MKELPEEIRRLFVNSGRKGGKSKSRIKLRAIKLNAKLGGRPKGSKNKKKKDLT